ncbi:hypothetical protein PtA15_14A384 [Puccinia triticina]|uniref:Uncharacterized protein n=1 Tax=Puccinia triticina TaxID=208348 RepID=A0ABY7D3P2_9BASI|nr:uncharacterized protein PtA15_14A384 [Puccinia triticina]WAQ91500.1 hypothetical protein PtA15_14A384 [Puccinia triticina]
MAIKTAQTSLKVSKKCTAGISMVKTSLKSGFHSLGSWEKIPSAIKAAQNS